MAEAAVVKNATENLTSILVDKLFREVSLLATFRQDFEFVCEELISIKALLNDVGDKRNSRSVSNWLDRLEEFLLDAVDTVEECGAGRCKLWNPIFRYKMGRRIRILKERISKIHMSTKYLTSLTSVLHVNERMQRFNEYNTQDKRERSNAIIKESQTVGMEHQIHDITELISQENGPQVIAIVGMGGRGKTLLLQHVFNSRKVREGFKHLVWLTASQKFSVNRLLFEMVQQLSTDEDVEEMVNEIVKGRKKMSKIRKFIPDVNEQDELEQLRGRIRKHLEGKRSLFAIDDVWDQHLLQTINLPLESQNTRITILITTRDKRVGEVMAPHLIYEMKGLDKENSRILFSIHAFPSGEESPRELNAVVDDVVEKCGGLPLALKTIGSHMARVNKLPQDWELTLRRLSEAEPMTDDVMHSLRLSYEALPDHVKPCFLYCSVFAKNTPINSESLVHAWIAEGFISTSTQEAAEDAYEVGCSYLDELVDLCLIEVSQFDGDGRVKYCKMHDLLHDFAHSESLKQRKCLLEPGGELGKLPGERCLGLHRISLVKNNISKIKETVQSPALRTLLLSYNYSLTSISPTFFYNMRYLTVLDLNRTSIRSLPGSIGDLKNLKYLNLCGCTSIRMLPRSLSGLKRLQFLDVSYCRKLKRLHSRIGEHKFLLHLNMKGCRRLRSLPVGISKLISLHTLKGARISMSKKAANALQLKDLKGLTLLQQLSLLIFGGDNETSRRTTQLEEGIFMGMTKMRILEVFNHNSSVLLDLPEDMAKMERLEIVRLHGCKLPKWVFRLQNLNELKSCRDQSSDYGGLEKLRNLRTLHLSKNEKCVEFTEVFGEAGAFPKLQKLSIEYFKSLKIFPPLNDDAMPSLKYLRITECDKFVERPERFEGLERMEEEQDLERHNLPSELDTSLRNCFSRAIGLMCLVPCCWPLLCCWPSILCCLAGVSLIKGCLKEKGLEEEEEEEEEKNSKKEEVEKDEEEKKRRDDADGCLIMWMLCVPCCWLPMLCCCIQICLEQEKGVEKEEEEEKNNKKEEVEKDEEEEKNER